MTDNVRDELPEDLNVTEVLHPYEFPDNSRRRIPGYIYLALSTLLFVTWVTSADDAVLVNDGLLFAGAILLVVGVFSLTSGWRMTIDEKEALRLATRALGFAVGHSSAQQVWRGWRSRPTWRMFCYSGEEPPQKRGLVLVDAVDGRIVEKLVEANPEPAADSR